MNANIQNLLFMLRRSSISCYIICMTVLLNLEVTTFSLEKKNYIKKSIDNLASLKYIH